MNCHGNGRKRASVMVLFDQPHRFVVRIVVIAFVGDFHRHTIEIETLDQVLCQFSAGSGQVRPVLTVTGYGLPNPDLGTDYNRQKQRDRQNNHSCQVRRTSVNWAPVALVQLSCRPETMAQFALLVDWRMIELIVTSTRFWLT